MIQVTKGMRDFYPAEYRVREWLFDQFKVAALASGFEFYDSPVVEAEELYIRKAGEEISEQIYKFKDKSGRDLALRPEMTPSLARMVISRYKELPGVIKWTSIPQCFRYERMTRGRKREHYQWNLDYLGEESVFAEAEVIATAIHAIERMGLDSNEVKVRISNRRLLSDLLLAMDLDTKRIHKVFLQVDKLGKMEDEKLAEQMVKEADIGLEMAHKILSVIRLKELSEVKDLVGSLKASEDGLSEVVELFGLLQNMGYGDYLVFDLSIVRGLAYYTGTVFEFFDASASLRAIAGGGRYDHLIENLANADLPEKARGSVSKPAVGFGFGDVVILELLKDRKKLPEFKPAVDFYLAPFGKDEALYLLPLLKKLRKAGFSAQLHFPPGKPGKMLNRAEKLGAHKVILAGSREREEGLVRLKNLTSGEEENLKRDEIIS